MCIQNLYAIFTPALRIAPGNGIMLEAVNQRGAGRTERGRTPMAYNGWTNHATWAVTLYLEDVLEQTGIEGGMNWSARIDALKDWFWGTVDINYDDNPLASEMLHSAAGSINWFEIDEDLVVPALERLAERV